jgi:hypothetical protein
MSSQVSTNQILLVVQRWATKAIFYLRRNSIFSRLCIVQVFPVLL